MGFGKSRLARIIQGLERAFLWLALLAATGCVDRRFIIESDVPNTQVIINDKPIGAAPAHSSFEYYGWYDLTLVHRDTKTLYQRVHVTSPWYGYPPFDFLAEVVWPFHIRDTRRYFFHLEEAPKTRLDELINRADALRDRGYNLPLPADPAPPKAPITPSPVAPNALPPVVPQPAPTLPPGSVSPGPNNPSPQPNPGGVVPSVLPPGQ